MRRHTFGRRLGSLAIEMYQLIRTRKSWRPIRLMIEMDFESYGMLQCRDRQDYINTINTMYSFLDVRRFEIYCREQVAQAFGC